MCIEEIYHFIHNLWHNGGGGGGNNLEGQFTENLKVYSKHKFVLVPLMQNGTGSLTFSERRSITLQYFSGGRNIGEGGTFGMVI